MEKFTQHTGLVAPLDRSNVDTDQIIPKQFLQKTERVGFGQHLFHDWRYLDEAGTQDNPAFVLNKPQYKDASILLARENFGCGSSREHAPWAIQEYGFKVVIAPSFADIFYANCINIGVLPIQLTDQEVEHIFALTATKDVSLEVDLTKKTVKVENEVYTFDISEFQQYCLELGVDSVGWTLKQESKITEFESQLPAWQ